MLAEVTGINVGQHPDNILVAAGPVPAAEFGIVRTTVQDMALGRKTLKQFMEYCQSHFRLVAKAELVRQKNLKYTDLMNRLYSDCIGSMIEHCLLHIGSENLVNFESGLDVMTLRKRIYYGGSLNTRVDDLQ